MLEPSALGGLKSPTYLQYNPLGKMPLLRTPEGLALYESQVIAHYLMERYRDREPKLSPDSPDWRAKSRLVVRLLDNYLHPQQPAMYKAMKIDDRARALREIDFIVGVLEGICHPEGPFFMGEDVTFADAAAFPTFQFLTFMLPRYFGWSSVFKDRPRLARWWEAIQEDPVAKRVLDEMKSVLDQWEKKGRWRELGIEQQVANKSYKWALR